MSKFFNLEIKSDKSKARYGVMETPHGKVKTPFFMTIATTGAVKTIDSVFLKEMETQILLSNTYHLYLRPGIDLIKKVGGLHKFMNWDKPILTDSGGYQVFSLAKMRKIKEEGAYFQSHLDGSKHLLTPEKSIEIQLALGSDILMVLDECPPHTETKKYIEFSLEMTTRWAKRSKEFFDANHEKFRYGDLDRPKLFGIVQGGMYLDLRKKSLEQLSEVDFDGMAIGGVSVGEGTEEMRKIVAHLGPQMPEDKPRYVMGVGFPDEIVYCVKQGIDMFDCVIPTRHARHGSLFAFTDKEAVGTDDFYKMLNIKNEIHKDKFEPIDNKCACFTCKNYSRSYLWYLFNIGEMLGYRLATIHNVYFYLEMMKMLRKKIKQGKI